MTWIGGYALDEYGSEGYVVDGGTGGCGCVCRGIVDGCEGERICPAAIEDEVEVLETADGGVREE